METTGYLVSIFLEGIRRSLIKEMQSYRVIDDEIESAREELLMVQAFLKDADAKQLKDGTIGDWVREITRLSYRIEDALATYAITAQSTKREGRLWRKFRACAVIKGSTAESETVTQIRGIKYRIAELKAKLERYGVNKIGEEEGDQSLRQIPVRVPAGDFVGMEAERDLVVNLLFGVEKNCAVVSICGMGGTGKTALALEVLNHQEIVRHFDVCATVYVGRTFQTRKILEDVLIGVSGRENKNELSCIDNINLARKLDLALRHKRFLVFLDDVWHLNDWDGLVGALRVGSNDSKLLLTTRMRDVAEVASGKECTHKMKPLNEEESWELFKRKAFSRAGPGQLPVEMGRKIASRCQGLPLAITKLGSFMSTRHTLSEWEMAYQNTDLHLNNEFSGIAEVLASSFYDLPDHLKLCFLYLGFFPGGDKIEIEKLYLLWMAEGIIESEDSGREETMMEIADQYFRELELKCLVELQEEEVPTAKRFKSCSIHQLMRQLCLKKAKEDEFLKVVDLGRGSKLPSDSFAYDNSLRRLVICLDKYEGGYPVPLIDQSASYLKCLLIYCAFEKQPQAVLPSELSELSKFNVLRTLDFNGLDFRQIKLPRGISALICLRYLSFKGCVLEALPSEIGRLSYLLALDLRIRPWCKMTIPNVLQKLKRLKHLYLPQAFMISEDRILRLNGLTQLETLEQFNSNVCHAEDLSEMINLRYLTTSTEGRIEDLEWIIRRMNMTTEHTIHCSIDVRNFDCYTEERHTVFRQLMGCHVLQTISMEGHLGQIPPCHKISQCLVKIVFSGSQLKEDPMHVFQNLPNLRMLVLNDDAFLGAEMVCSPTGFSELRRLELSNLHFLEKWRIDKGALGKLTTLAIENCSKLELLPPGVKFISNVKNLRIRNMPPAFEEKLRVINETVGEDGDNIPDVTSISSDN